MPVEYRPFRNTDPPFLVQIWNEAMTGRGAAFLQGVTPLEHYVLSKPYFNPNGLIVAVDGSERVGFAHAGFGANGEGQKLAPDPGVICVVAVRPGGCRRGIGSELLRRAEAYLRDRGARTIYFGAMRPLNPFYLGVYGGSELPGVLVSEAAAEPFLQKHGYELWDSCAVLQLNLEQEPEIADPRFLALRRAYTLETVTRPVSKRWFEEAVLSPCELLRFELRESRTGTAVAAGMFWEMDLYGWRWHQSCAGIIEVDVAESHRRQGLGKYLMHHMLHYLHEQFFTLVEVQTMQRNLAAISLYRGLGFREVDQGRVYRKT